MITTDKIDEWMREVEERPTSAPNILRYIANRLRDLTERNEELQAENILLRTEKKIEEYENRINNLEYQVELLKRQLSGETVTQVLETTSLILYNRAGQVLRIELAPTDPAASSLAGRFPLANAHTGAAPGMLAASTLEELLFIFSSGRTAAMPVAELPAADRENLDWRQATLQEPRGGEELVAVTPVARMALYDFAIQVTRRGYLKKIHENFFETHIAGNYIGAGVKLPSDQTCQLIFCRKEDLVVLASKEGYVIGLEASRLPFTIEEVVKLSPTDHIVSAFIPGKKPDLLGVTQIGKAIHRERDWLEAAVSFKSHGQALFSKARREAGVRVVAAAAVEEGDWGAVLSNDGAIHLHRMSEVFSTGSFHGTDRESGPGSEVLAFAAFEALPDQRNGQRMAER